MNKMKELRIEKLTLNVGAGTNQETLKKGIKLIKNLTGKDAVKTISNKRIPSWGVRPGLPVGCKITLRGKEVEPLLKRLLAAKENRLNPSCFDDSGNLAFGIPEYIDIPELNYDASIGIMGFQVCVTLIRPGYRVKRRHLRPASIGHSHLITREDSISFFKEKFNIVLEEE
jgi:large subunit ribosomal protein L5